MSDDQLRTEAEMLAARSCLERSDYLFEVAHSRGPEEADALAREVMRIKCGGCTDAQHPVVGDFLT